MSEAIKDILARVGISSKTVNRVRFGGIVGKLALIGVISIAFIAGIGLRSSDKVVQIVCALSAVLVAIASGGAILAYGLKHPEHATLEGTEVIALQHVQQLAAAKGIPFPPPSIAVLQGVDPAP